MPNADHHLGALTFVMRSQDSTMWYKDGHGNFVVPIPSKYVVWDTMLRVKGGVYAV